MPTYSTLSNNDLIKKRMENPAPSNTKCTPNPSDTPENAKKLHAFSRTTTNFIPLPDVDMCKQECGRVATTRPVVRDGPSGPRPGMYPNELCDQCAAFLGVCCLLYAAYCGCGRERESADCPRCRFCYLDMPCVTEECTGKRWRPMSVLCSTCALALPCANAEKTGCKGTRWRPMSVLCSTCALALPCANAEKKGCTGKRWNEDSVLCSTCALALPCANAEKKGCTGKRWRSGSVLCSTCALALPCEGKNCDHTRSRESEPLCFDCQGRKKCSRCNLVYTEGSGKLYCEKCKPFCKVKGMECDGMAMTGKRYCRDCKPPKKTSSKKGGRCMKKGRPL